MSEKKRDLTINYSCIHWFYWMNFAVVSGFISVYLLDKGFSNTAIGMIIACAGICSAILQPIIAGYADRFRNKNGSFSLKILLMVLCVAMLCLAVFLMVFKEYKWLSGIFYSGSMMMLQLTTPFINALGIESMNQGHKLNFGISRGMGSVAYAAASYLLGIAVAKLNADILPVAMILIWAAMIVSVYRYPSENTAKPSSMQQERLNSHKSLTGFFVHYKRFGLVLIGSVLVYISHALLNNFTFQIVESKGGGSSEMGFAVALACAFEIPTMCFFGYMVKKLRSDIWLRISGVFFMLKTLGTLLAPNIMTFYMVQSFQALGYGVGTVSSVYYVNALMEKEDAVKGQAYMTMSYTLGSVIGALVSGTLLDKMGVNATLALITAVAAVGMMIIIIAAEKTRTES